MSNAARIRRQAYRLPGCGFFRLCVGILILAGIPFCCVLGQTAGSDGEDIAGEAAEDSAPIAPFIRPAPTGTASFTAEASAINWSGLMRSSLFFLGVQHAFRYSTEEMTRNVKGPLWDGYMKSVTSLRGWSDGDPFYVNYVGHPMQGAVSGYLWVQNDQKYKRAVFGANPQYWKGRLRAAAFAWAYSAQFEIGPISEATIGYIQSKPPATGFVDHVVTPSAGLLWMVTEDMLDRYVVLPLENRTRNPYVRMLLRGWLNPARTFANAMAFRVPWYRETRDGIFAEETWSSHARTVASQRPYDASEYPELAPFEFMATTRHEFYTGPNSVGSCQGGSGTVAFRISNSWQIVAEVGGCRVTGLAENFSGDSLTYLIGPRWAPAANRRLNPYAQFLVGGNKITQEELYPEKKRALEALAIQNGSRMPRPDEYTRLEESHALALSAGTGLDLRLNRALALRLAGIEYKRAWTSPLNGIHYGTGFQFSTGMILRMGTW